MTAQYEQGDINLQDATPLVFSTPDDSPVSVQLGTIRDDETLIVQFYGGGADPADPNANNYVAFQVVMGIFLRLNGVGFLNPGVINLLTSGFAFGAAITLVDVPAPDLVTQCFLTITPAPGSPAYNHSWKVSEIKF